MQRTCCFVLTLVQYFYTSGSSPGFVIDAMSAANGTHATYLNMSRASIQSASKNGNITSSANGNQLGRNNRMNSSSWLKLVMDLYPPGHLAGIGPAPIATLFSLPAQSIAMIVTNVSFSLIIIVFG
ncbi:protein S-acyltransferase 10 [Iris pallida]|uniref:Protein S-acyltransferase 10 n=1 Tax=Iris pallida TaxID=29817 RepID=A0AAX6GBR7_IRIPA|nr:protein S-acyltransferase 10 [Iris pallida]